MRYILIALVALIVSATVDARYAWTLVMQQDATAAASAAANVDDAQPITDECAEW